MHPLQGALDMRPQGALKVEVGRACVLLRDNPFLDLPTVIMWMSATERFIQELNS